MKFELEKLFSNVLLKYSDYIYENHINYENHVNLLFVRSLQYSHYCRPEFKIILPSLE
jgi:hypothetical protein